MLDEILEYQQYTFDIDNPEVYVDRLKYDRLIKKKFSGLKRALTIIARHFLFEVYSGERSKERTIEALKSWLGHKMPGNDVSEEARSLYKWLPDYIKKVLLPEKIRKLEKDIRESELTETDKEELGMIISRLTGPDPLSDKMELAERLVQRCTELEFKPKNEVYCSINKIKGSLCELAGKSYNSSGYIVPEDKNDYKAIIYDRVIGNAVRAGCLKKYYLACDRFLIGNITMGAPHLKESDLDIVLKSTAQCMLELSKKGSVSVISTKAVYFNESDLANWLIKKKCDKDKLEKFKYQGEPLFEHVSLSGYAEGEKTGRDSRTKGKNIKKIRLNQKWLRDSGFEILEDDHETDVIKNYLQMHPEGRVFIDNGASKLMTEIKNK